MRLKFLILVVACGWCCPVAYTADTPVPLIRQSAKATPPQNILDALTACEADRQAIAAADAAIASANATLKDATDDKGKAQLAATNDYAAFIALWSSLYSPTPAPPVPPPTPPTPPVPPTPPPTPPPVAQTSLTLITATGDWCAACLSVAKDTLPAMQTSLGSRLTVADYSSAAAKTFYPESAFVPRWVLTRADGTVEKKIGYLTVQQVQDWIGSKGGAK